MLNAIENGLESSVTQKDDNFAIFPGEKTWFYVHESDYMQNLQQSPKRGTTLSFFQGKNLVLFTWKPP